ncbi:DNA-binding protein [Oleiagrimonas sp. C23AA]|nr:DNA-binding protein [Oleiagrimonas sp. C23AA]
MVTARRSFVGQLPVERLKRLAQVLEGTDGQIDYEIDFGRDELGAAYFALRATTSLTLLCQRTLEPFQMPVKLDTRLGLISDESEESGLPPGYEPLLVEDNRVDPAAVIEDELLLVVPLVPVSPQSEWPEDGHDVGLEDVPPEAPEDNPFAVLRELKKH